MSLKLERLRKMLGLGSPLAPKAGASMRGPAWTPPPQGVLGVQGVQGVSMGAYGAQGFQGYSGSGDSMWDRVGRLEAQSAQQEKTLAMLFDAFEANHVRQEGSEVLCVADCPACKILGTAKVRVTLSTLEDEKAENT